MVLGQWKCSGCGRENPESIRRCRGCGTLLALAEQPTLSSSPHLADYPTPPIGSEYETSQVKLKSPVSSGPPMHWLVAGDSRAPIPITESGLTIGRIKLAHQISIEGSDISRV